MVNTNTYFDEDGWVLIIVDTTDNTVVKEANHKDPVADPKNLIEDDLSIETTVSDYCFTD